MHSFFILHILHRMSKLRPQVRLLAFASLLNDTASEMIYPLLPVFLTSVLGATPVTVPEPSWALASSASSAASCSCGSSSCDKNQAAGPRDINALIEE